MKTVKKNTSVSVSIQVEILKKMGKSELVATVLLLLTCGDDVERAEIYGCAADRQQAKGIEGMGFTVVPFGQGFKNMLPPTK